MSSLNSHIAPGGGSGAGGVAVSKNSGATVGTQERINLIEGTGIVLTVADDPGNGEVDITIASNSTGVGDKLYRFYTLGGLI